MREPDRTLRLEELRVHINSYVHIWADCVPHCADMRHRIAERAIERSIAGSLWRITKLG